MYESGKAYQVPVSNQTIEKVIDTLTDENNKLKEENQKLKKMLERSHPNANQEMDREQLQQEIDKYF